MYYSEAFYRDHAALKPEAERRIKAEGKRAPDEWAPLNGIAWRAWDEAVEIRALRMLRGEDRRPRSA